MVAANPIRVLLAEPFELTRRGIHSILSGDPQFQITCDLDDVGDAPSAWIRETPDVSILGVASKSKPSDRQAALDSISEIVLRSERAGVIAVTDVSSIEDLVEPIRAGAKAVLGRQAEEDLLLRAVTSVSRGQYFLGTCLAELLFTHLRERKAGSRNGLKDVEMVARGQISALTQRENEVLEELIQGYRTAEIATHLRMSQATVKTHVRQICRKLNVRGRTEAILKALHARSEHVAPVVSALPS
jgi:DNA-binding NarL/FixJ family response regulator